MSSDSLQPEVPTQIGGYRIEEELAAGWSYRARDAAGRVVVLKILDSDCLLRGQLHPMIRDRLGRVREAAHLGLANLYGVERDDGRAFAVWEYVEGATLEDWLAAGREPGELRRLGHELAAAVEALHALGIVHGAIHERNVLVTEAGGVRLTHVSPFLYNEPEVDVEAVLPVLKRLGCEDVVDSFGGAPVDLRELVLRLGVRGGDRAAPAPAPVAGADREAASLRNLALIGAAAAALAGAGVAWGVWYWGGRSAPPPHRGTGYLAPRPPAPHDAGVARTANGVHL
jgi:serine/threonine protein kinase